MGQPLLGDADVVFHLPLQGGANLGKVHSVGKLQDVSKVQLVQVGFLVLRHRLHRLLLLEEHLPVPFDADDVCMLVPNLRQGGVARPFHPDDDVQPGGGVQQLLGADAPGQQLAGPFQVIGSHLAQHLQPQAGVSGHRPQDGAGADALHVAGGGDDDPLGVFDDVAAASGGDFLRHSAQSLLGLSGGQGDGDRLGTAKGGNQLLPEDAQIGFVSCMFQHF